MFDYQRVYETGGNIFDTPSSRWWLVYLFSLFFWLILRQISMGEMDGKQQNVVQQFGGMYNTLT